MSVGEEAFPHASSAMVTSPVASEPAPLVRAQGKEDMVGRTQLLADELCNHLDGVEPSMVNINATVTSTQTTHFDTQIRMDTFRF
jgi:hypothetical protein